jgi:hypothetical protein
LGLITGFGDQLEAAKLEHHAKPFSSDELLQVVATALRGSAPVRA